MKYTSAKKNVALFGSSLRPYWTRMDPKLNDRPYRKAMGRHRHQHTGRKTL